MDNENEIFFNCNANPQMGMFLRKMLTAVTHILKTF